MAFTAAHQDGPTAVHQVGVQRHHQGGAQVGTPTCTKSASSTFDHVVGPCRDAGAVDVPGRAIRGVSSSTARMAAVHINGDTNSCLHETKYTTS